MDEEESTWISYSTISLFSGISAKPDTPGLNSLRWNRVFTSMDFEFAFLSTPTAVADGTSPYGGIHVVRFSASTSVIYARWVHGDFSLGYFALLQRPALI